jgi:tryptophan-rich hypothetical protein
MERSETTGVAIVPSALPAAGKTDRRRGSFPAVRQGAAGWAKVPPMNAVHPKKLLLSKWTAVAPQDREKHFLVSALVLPEVPEAALQWVEIEAVHSGRTRRIPWRELRDATRWQQGWR